MPTRNQARFLEVAIESVMSQGVPGLRLWVQDGASTDGTQGLLAHLALRHPGLAWASEPDAGPADALNRAFNHVLSDPATTLVGWLNSDDLYTAGALCRVLDHLAGHPNHVAVYGDGTHIDAQGAPLGLYPTRPPDLPLSAWADGCPICQPTMWLRREALQAVLPLDACLRTAFDFDAWLRLWRVFPGRIGHVQAVQALSRLHDEGITLSQRRRVALEGLQVVHRHLGCAPAHWLLTWAEELLSSLPDGEPTPLALRLAHTLKAAEGWLSPEGLQTVRQRWRQHRALALALQQAVIPVWPDGWMGACVPLRVRTLVPTRLTLRGRHEGAQATPLTLTAIDTRGQRQTQAVGRRGPFTWTLDLPDTSGYTETWLLQAEPCFVPAASTPGATDARALAWLLDQMSISR